MGICYSPFEVGNDKRRFTKADNPVSRPHANGGSQRAGYVSRTALQMWMRRQNFSVLIVQRLADILSLDFDEMGEIFFPDMM